MRNMSAICLLLGVAAAGACTDDSVSGLEDERLVVDLRANAADQLRVLTWNVYVGTDVDNVMATENPEEIPGRVEAAYQTLLDTDFNERAGAIVREIKHAQPDLIGLQEITLIRTQSPGDILTTLNLTPNAQTVVFDFLAILEAELALQGLDYRTVAAIENVDVEVPRANALPPDDVRMTDYDVVLARSDLEIVDVITKNYAVKLEFQIAGALPIQIFRGYAAVDAVHNGTTYRFVSTHLEPSAPVAAVQIAQAAELLGDLSAVSGPVIVVGDLNSQADGSSTSTYQNFLNAGFRDVWTEDQGRERSGFTCCQHTSLRRIESELQKRIDFVLFRPGSGEARPLSGPVRAWVVGEEQRTRTRSGLWPSDHAGVAAQFLLPALPNL